jgi:hypothetical protein
VAVLAGAPLLPEPRESASPQEAAEAADGEPVGVASCLPLTAPVMNGYRPIPLSGRGTILARCAPTPGRRASDELLALLPAGDSGGPVVSLRTGDVVGLVGSGPPEMPTLRFVVPVSQRALPE